MKLFLVSPSTRSVEPIKQLLEANFADFHIALPRRGSLCWIVALDQKRTSAWLSEELGMVSKEGSDVNSGLVVEINTYYGYDNPGLWQQLETWESL